MDDNYLCGLFDGEGYITSQYRPNHIGRRSYTRLMVGLGMCHEPCVRAMQERFGGSVHRRSTRSGRPMYEWYVTGSKAIPALEVFAEKCLAKGEQAVVGLEIAHLMGSTPKARTKRQKGEKILSDAEMSLRADLVAKLTSLKRYTDT